jgi:hypothetical protein
MEDNRNVRGFLQYRPPVGPNYQDVVRVNKTHDFVAFKGIDGFQETGDLLYYRAGGRLWPIGVKRHLHWGSYVLSDGSLEHFCLRLYKNPSESTGPAPGPNMADVIKVNTTYDDVEFKGIDQLMTIDGVLYYAIGEKIWPIGPSSDYYTGWRKRADGTPYSFCARKVSDVEAKRMDKRNEKNRVSLHFAPDSVLPGGGGSGRGSGRGRGSGGGGGGMIGSSSNPPIWQESGDGSGGGYFISGADDVDGRGRGRGTGGGLAPRRGSEWGVRGGYVTRGGYRGSGWY